MTTLNAPAMVAVIEDVIAERHRQHARWGEQDLPDGTGGPHSEEALKSARFACEWAVGRNCLTWRHVLAEEVAEAFAETDPTRLRAELIQVAAVALQWVEHIDRRLK